MHLQISGAPELMKLSILVLSISTNGSGSDDPLAKSGLSPSFSFPCDLEVLKSPTKTRSSSLNKWLKFHHSAGTNPVTQNLFLNFPGPSNEQKFLPDLDFCSLNGSFEEKLPEFARVVSFASEYCPRSWEEIVVCARLTVFAVV